MKKSVKINIILPIFLFMSVIFLNQNNFKNRCSNGCVILANYKIAIKMKNTHKRITIQIADCGFWSINCAIPNK